eukprot:TRINITY_DN4742_c0_g1_i13.p5 TRINITY_DN4742_c0_g1~~TRINITY_DN4742_c0_g1_i13.p5  ORF type:complete len:128 (-),score=15.63 TRINITY_DN4742_c0_g1_i13:136-519(-)
MPPKTVTEFQRELKSLGDQNDLKYRYIKNCGIEVVWQVLRVDIDAEIIEHIIHAVECSMNMEYLQEKEFVYLLLSKLTECGRFNLSILLISKTAKEKLLQLFDVLEAHLDEQKHGFEELKRKYRVCQ